MFSRRVLFTVSLVLVFVAITSTIFLATTYPVGIAGTLQRENPGYDFSGWKEVKSDDTGWGPTMQIRETEKRILFVKYHFFQKRYPPTEEGYRRYKHGHITTQIEWFSLIGFCVLCIIIMRFASWNQS